ncbi:hypothetical protein V3C99_012581, partial [Haemonchus contortus]
CLIAIFVKFTSMSSNWVGLPLKPLEISSKYDFQDCRQRDGQTSSR